MSQDPYFPHGVVDLRYVISCEPQGDKDIRLRTNQKLIKLSADSVPSRDEWLKAIRKIMFKAQNMGDSVKVCESSIAVRISPPLIYLGIRLRSLMRQSSMLRNPF